MVGAIAGDESEKQKGFQVSKRIHVVPHDQGWATRREGSERVSSIHRTQTSAEGAARDVAIRERGEVVIHRPDGRIRDANSYGNDPFPPKG
jgi:hypothetical protein